MLYKVLLTALIAGMTVSARWAPPAGPSAYHHEPYRPQFHFTPEKNWMNDPNGLVYYQGKYHLFYQYNPYAEVWGHMSWGHAVSRDLVHWRHLAVALREQNGIMIFSGGAVVDGENTSGFGTRVRPPLVAIYTGHGHGRQTQNLAYSLDRGRTWTKYAGNPVIDIQARDFRDPKVFWYGAAHEWVMIVSLAREKRVRFYASKDLKKWSHLSDFGPAGAQNPPNWECPDMYELPVSNEPGVSRWVLVVGIGDHAVAGGSGVQYFVGNFDGKRFVNDNPPQKVLWVDYGKDFYAAQTWSDIPSPDGRRIMLGWMDNWQYAEKVPTHPWRGQQSIPRVVTLRRLSEGIRMTQVPVRELQELRTTPFRFQARIISGSSGGLEDKRLSGDTLEIAAEFQLGTASEFGIKVRGGVSQETTIGYDVGARQLFVDRSRSGEVGFSKDFPGRQGAPLAPEGRAIRLHIFVDRCSVEVFGNDGQIVITDLIFPSPGSKGIQIFAKDGRVTLRLLQAWKLRSTWTR